MVGETSGCGDARGHFIEHVGLWVGDRVRAGVDEFKLNIVRVVVLLLAWLRTTGERKNWCFMWSAREAPHRPPVPSDVAPMMHACWPL